VRYFGNLSNIDDRVRNISWQTLNLTQTLTLTLILTLILTLTLNPNLIHTYIYTAIYVRQVAEIVYGIFDVVASGRRSRLKVAPESRPRHARRSIRPVIRYRRTLPLTINNDARRPPAHALATQPIRPYFIVSTNSHSDAQTRGTDRPFLLTF